MARQIPSHRFSELVHAGTGVFIEFGYQRAQMADVASALGVAKGTLYGYVESKEALFLLCTRYCDTVEAMSMSVVGARPDCLATQPSEIAIDFINTNQTTTSKDALPTQRSTTPTDSVSRHSSTSYRRQSR